MFEDWIRGEARAPADYLAPRLALAKFLLDTTGNGVPYRWFSFDESTVTDWYAVNTGQANATYDEFAAVRDAVAAWRDLNGANIRLNYAGTTTLSQARNLTAVIWDDPDNQIGGSYDPRFGGTLAFGGAAIVTSTLRDYNGTAYHPIVQGFIVTQDGAAVAFNGNGGLNGAEILTHELGHTLGFGHPCTDADCTAAERNATMYRLAHADGRGASLRSDDIAAAEFLYQNLGLIFGDDFE